MSQELPLGPLVASGFDNIKRVWTQSRVPFALAVVPSILFTLLPTDLFKQGAAGVLAFWLLIAAIMASRLMMTGLAYRLAATEPPPQKVRFHILSLQLGSMEWRYLISVVMVYLLFLFYAVLVVFLTLVFAAIIAYGRGQQLTMDGVPAILNELGSPGVGAVALVAVLGIVGGVWLYLRVSLSQVVSLYGERVQVLSSAALTKGRVWALLPPLGLLGLYYGLGFVVVSLIQNQNEFSGIHRIFLNIASGIWTVFVQIPFSAGVFASIYQRLKAADKVGSDRPDSALGNGSNDGVFTD